MFDKYTKFVVKNVMKSLLLYQVSFGKSKIEEREKKEVENLKREILGQK